MADIDLERKSGGGKGWLWGLLALLALIAIVWWVWPDDEADVAGAEIEAVQPVTPAATPEPVATGEATLADIMGNPGQYVGQSFPGGQVTIGEVPTDRGFWIQEQGQRLFAIIVDQPQEEPLDINQGQTLQIERGMLRDATFLTQLPGAPLDAQTEELARQQDVFLVVEENAISMM